MFFSIIVSLENVDGETFFCSILDTAGQEEFYSLRDLYMRQCDGFILVYSITDRKSLDNVTDFVKHLKRVKDCTDIPLVLIGNKSDLESERQISRVQGKNLAELLEIKHFYETSAKTGDNVNEAFEQIIRLTSAHLKQTKKQTPPSPRKKQTKKCCIM